MIVDLGKLASKCPYCGTDNYEATEVGTAPGIVGSVMIRHHDTPNEGDVSVCIRCGGVALFTGLDRNKRRPTESERAELLADEDVQRAVRAVHAVHDSTAGGRNG